MPLFMEQLLIRNMKTIRNYFINHPFAIGGLLAVPIIILILAMDSYFPKQPPAGFDSFIVAFEFSHTVDQLQLLFGNFTPTDIKNIDKGNYLDFGFMLCYSAFLFLMFKQFIKISRKKWLVAGLILSVIILLADFSENMVLLSITKAYLANSDETILASLLTKLQIVTWIKWEGLAIVFFLLAREMTNKSWLNRITFAACVAPLLLSFFAFSLNPKWINNFTMFVFIAFFALFVFSVFYKLQKKATK